MRWHACSARDSIFRAAWVTKPAISAAVVIVVKDGQIALEGTSGRGLAELQLPAVVRTPVGPVGDTIRAVTPISVAGLHTFRARYS